MVFRSYGKYSSLLLALSVTGAGCLSELPSPHVAEPLLQDATQNVAASREGFGALPQIKGKAGRPSITFVKPVPDFPDYITVLKQRAGTPNETELRNLTAAIHLPGGMVGNRTQAQETTLEWTDEQHFAWHYRASTRSLEFSLQTAPTQPFTIATLPKNDDVIQIANTFLSTRGIKLQYYRDGLVVPDWNLWWIKGQELGRCMDAGTLFSIREIAGSVSLIGGQPPGLPLASSTRCTATEFPSHVVVRYQAMVDGLDVVDQTGAHIQGIELVVDVIRHQVTSGKMTLTTDPERSEYPTLSAQAIKAAVQQGGLAGTSGDIHLTDYSIVFLKEDAYLVPSLLATGTRKKSDGSFEGVQLITPLIKH